MKQVLIRQGQAVVEDVPAPQVEPGMVLVTVDHSCISIGTEMSGLRTSDMPLWKRALKQPGKVKRVFELAATQGIGRTLSQVQGKLQAGNPTGYSAAGIVLDVGGGIDDIAVGDRVACAGAQYAHHAEIIRATRNLTVHVPDEVGFPVASTVTLGAIAMQGVRRAVPTLGESFVVIGLGVLGQITAQLLRANGCRVIGVDLDAERIALAESLGMEVGVYPDQGDRIDQVARLTDGIGADGVIITAATPSDAVVSTAFKLCRKKGRVVLVGDVGLNINREDMYQKELDFFISTSYGPGRYDRRYEEEGADYPVGYVRWTENRNLAEYLRLIADGKLSIEPLITETYPIDEAPEAYAALKSGEKKPLMVLLSYAARLHDSEAINRVVPNPTASPAKKGRLGVAIIGAGAFAQSMHLPNIQKLSDRYHVRTICDRIGTVATAAARQFGADNAATDVDAVLADDAVDLAIVTTRHNQHAELSLKALEAGKHVLVEKPLALSRDELRCVVDFYGRSTDDKPVLLVGFNRRFSPFAQRMAEITSKRTHPMVLNYRMNAGYIPLDHWVHGEEGGGRNLGEACHIYDLFTFFTGARVRTVEALAIHPKSGHYGRNDNFAAVMNFEDGSVATLTYTALGAKDYPKEQMDIFVDGKVLTLNDYRSLTIAGAPAKGVATRTTEKGHREEIIALADTIKNGGDWPIPLWQLVQATEIAFSVEEQLDHASS